MRRPEAGRLQMTVNSSCFNPITVCIGIFMVLFLSVGVQLGASIGEIAQHIFLPYSVDITRGVGKQGATVFRAISLVLQLAVIGSVVARCNSQEKKVNALLSAVGVLLTSMYFIVLAVAYILPRLH